MEKKLTVTVSPQFYVVVKVNFVVNVLMNMINHTFVTVAIAYSLETIQVADFRDAEKACTGSWLLTYVGGVYRWRNPVFRTIQLKLYSSAFLCKVVLLSLLMKSQRVTAQIKVFVQYFPVVLSVHYAVHYGSKSRLSTESVNAVQGDSDY